MAESPSYVTHRQMRVALLRKDHARLADRARELVDCRLQTVHMCVTCGRTRLTAAAEHVDLNRFDSHSQLAWNQVYCWSCDALVDACTAEWNLETGSWLVEQLDNSDHYFDSLLKACRAIRKLQANHPW